MPIGEVVEKYLQLINTEYFAKFEKDFVYRLQIGLNQGYKRRFYEPAMVAVIEGIVNSLNGLSVSANRFKISARSIFIHGNKSQVEFEYYGQRVQRELGDLLFILSVIYNKRKYFEKFTISQFKKKMVRWFTTSWTLEPQFYPPSQSFQVFHRSKIIKRLMRRPRTHLQLSGLPFLLFEFCLGQLDWEK